MKQIIAAVVITLLVSSCKDEVLQEPKKPISKEVMVDIMYDLAILEAIKYQNPVSLDTLKINSREFILKKYKVDSLQFAQSNQYYATDYESYKEMFDEISKRLAVQQRATDSIVKIEDKKAAKEAKKKVKDTVKEAKKPLTKAEIDAINRNQPLDR